MTNNTLLYEYPIRAKFSLNWFTKSGKDKFLKELYTKIHKENNERKINNILNQLIGYSTPDYKRMIKFVGYFGDSDKPSIILIHKLKKNKGVIFSLHNSRKELFSDIKQCNWIIKKVNIITLPLPIIIYPLSNIYFYICGRTELRKQGVKDIFISRGYSYLLSSLPALGILYMRNIVELDITNIEYTNAKFLLISLAIFFFIDFMIRISRWWDNVLEINEKKVESEIQHILATSGTHFVTEMCVPTSSGTACADIVATHNNEKFLIEIKSGKEVDINDIANLEKIGDYLKRESQKVNLFLITSKGDIDKNIENIAKLTNINIVTLEEFKEKIKHLTNENK